MICAGIDTAGKSASVALMQDGRLLYETTRNAGMTHSQTLLPMLDEAFCAVGITPAQVDLYGVCAGPGSFTGLRIGLATVKGLAFVQNTPCAPVSTLDALAAAQTGEGTVVCALDARRNEVYWAAFNLSDHARLTEDAANPIENLDNFIKNCKKPVFFVGDGSVLCYNRYDPVPGVVRCPVSLSIPRGVGVCLAALRMAEQGQTVPPAELLPDYHRLSQAERERARWLNQSAGGE